MKGMTTKMSSAVSKARKWGLLVLSIFTFLHVSLSPAGAQSAFDLISSPKYSASNYGVYPDSVGRPATPPPAGKRPFYISHYGRHGSRYLSNRKGYEIPYKMLCKADSMDELTPVGREVLQDLKAIIDDAEGRWGDLTGFGKRQQRQIAERMMRNFPEVFHRYAFIDARSTNVPRCILSMGAAVLKMKALNPLLNVRMNCSFHDMWYMNHQDALLRGNMMPPSAAEAYKAFSAPRSRNPRLMELLFVDTSWARRELNEADLNYYLLKTALMQQNTVMGAQVQHLLNLFTFEDIHQFWQAENAWWYINYGPSLLNGGYQPYTQRYLLRQIIQDADSVMQHDVHGATLRFGHETVVLPLVCLLGLNGYDYQTLDLESLERSGWWACLVFPMTSNLQFVFYRSGPDDDDVLFKVLLNEKEAFLPLPAKMAPYYRWRDFRDYYLKKIDRYEALRGGSGGSEGDGIHSHLPNHSQKPVGTGW